MFPCTQASENQVRTDSTCIYTPSYCFAPYDSKYQVDWPNDKKTTFNFVSLCDSLSYETYPYPMILGTGNTGQKNSWAAAKPGTNLQLRCCRQASPSKQIQCWQHTRWKPLHSKHPGICTSTNWVHTIKVKPQQMQFTHFFFFFSCGQYIIYLLLIGSQEPATSTGSFLNRLEVFNCELQYLKGTGIESLCIHSPYRLHS